jgi:hypothetical protein
MHHWSDVNRGLAELGRIARDRVVILTWDPAGPGFWLTDEYFPGIAERDRRNFPGIADIARVLGAVSTHTVPVLHDCVDGFLGAYWRRPAAYLDPTIRSGSSGFSNLPGLDEGLTRLQRDLDTGDWHRRFGHLLKEDSLDIGYRLVVTEAG